MGNKCCTDQSVQSSQLVHSSTTPLTQNYSPTNIQQSYIDSQGNPLPNAYKRFVKPPTTVGRQSLIVRKLHENDQVPDWMWADGNNLLNSDHSKAFNQSPAHLANRRTFQEIEGRFQGLQTVNLSKLYYQQNTMLRSQKVNPNNTDSPINANNIRNTVQPKAFQSTYRSNDNQFIHGNNIQPFQQNTQPFQNLQQNTPPFQQKNQPFQQSIQPFQTSIQQNGVPNMPSSPTVGLKRTLSISQVPVVDSISGNGNMVQNNIISSNMVSVNNSRQQSPIRQMNVVRY